MGANKLNKQKVAGYVVSVRESGTQSAQLVSCFCYNRIIHSIRISTKHMLKSLNYEMDPHDKHLKKQCAASEQNDVTGAFKEEFDFRPKE